MISTEQLQSLEFWYDVEKGVYEYKDINIEVVDNGVYDEMVVDLKAFQLYGIRDVRDLKKLIELVYGK